MSMPTPYTPKPRRRTLSTPPVAPTPPVTARPIYTALGGGPHRPQPETVHEITAPLGTPPRVAPVTTRVTTLEAIAYVVGIFLVVIFGLTAATPVVTGKWEWGIATICVVAVVLFDTLLRRVIRRASKLALRITAGVCVLLFVIYAVGLSNSSIIDGHVYLSTSPTAKAAADTVLIERDASIIIANNRLMSLTPAQEKASFSQLQPALNTANAINALCFSTKADPAIFKPAYTALGNAAYWQEKALTNLMSNITESGTANNSKEAADRVTSLNDAALAQQLAASDAAVYHLKVGNS